MSFRNISSVCCACFVVVFSGKAFGAQGGLVARGTVISGTPSVSKYVLPNGLRVLLLRDTRNPVATVRIRLDAGANREEVGKTGLAHFFEHMMFRKTRFSEEGHYDKVLSELGGSGNAATSSEYVVFYSTFPAPALDTILKTESERMTGVELQEPYFSIEKGAVVSERGLRFDNVPAARGGEIIRRFADRGTPYEWPVIGLKKDVENMSIADVQRFFSDFYTPDNAIVSVGGPFEEKEMLSLVEKHFGSWKGKKAKHAVHIPSDYATRNKDVRFVCSEDVAEQTFSVVYPSRQFSLSDMYYSLAFQDALDDSPEGTFQRRLQKEQLATGFGFAKHWYQRYNPNAVAMFSLSVDQKFEKLLAVWKREVEKVLDRRVDKRFRERLVKQVEVSKANAALRMTSLLEEHETNEYFYGDFLATAGMTEFFRTLNEKKFRQWIKANIIETPFYVTGVVPRGMATECSQVSSKTFALEK
jgi:predicted Zn-dependent peptidase